MIHDVRGKRSAQTSASLQASDWLYLSLASLLLLLLCVVRSRGRLLWADESIGYTLFLSHSFHAVMRGWYFGADGGGPLYYSLGYLWFALVGLSVLTLRLFSTLGFIVALVFLWTSGRRYYSASIFAIAVSATLFLSRVTLWQAVNGRFYGLLLAATAFVVFCFLRAETIPSSPYLLGITALAHACLISSHVLGMVYSATLVLGLPALDLLKRRRLRPALYLAGLSGWVILPFCRHAIHATTSVARNVFWTTRPTVTDLIFGVASFNRVLLLLLLILPLGVILLKGTSRGRPAESESSWRSFPRLPIIVVTGSILSAHLILYGKSQRGLSIYSDRYLLPVSLATIFLLAEGMTRLSAALASKTSWRNPPVIPTILMATLVTAARAFTNAPYSELYPDPAMPARFASQLPPQRQVVVTESPTFIFLRLYEPDHQYVFISDRVYDCDPSQANVDVAGQYLLANWRRAGIAPSSILDYAELPQLNSDFTLLVDPMHDAWVQTRLVGNPALTLTRVGVLREFYTLTIWQVHRSGKWPVSDIGQAAAGCPVQSNLSQ